MRDILDPTDCVIDETNARTAKVTARIFSLDDNWDPSGTRYHQAVVHAENPIPVTDDTGTTIGSASVYVEGKVVMADLFLDYSTPARLDIETGARKLYPFPLGNLTFKIEDGPEIVTGMIIAAITLDPEPGADARIKALEL